MKTKIVYGLFSAIVLFSACSSPELDGKRVAKRFCDCEQEAINFRKQEYTKLMQNFSRQNFQARIAVREKMQEIDNRASRQRSECVQQAQEFFNKISQRHATNIQRNREFEHAFRNFRNPSAVTNDVLIPLVSQINNLILTIIPARPNIEKIKRDLVGRRITARPGGFFGDRWFWQIEEGDIRDIEIISESRRGDDYLFEARLILQRHGGAYEAIVNLIYVLRQYDDWTINVLESRDVSIVVTGNFCNCISIRRAFFCNREFRLEFTNHCDVALMVGGSVLFPHSRGWQRFSVIVPESGMTGIGGIGRTPGPFFIDHRIYFTERP